jgi:hypothetical protein
MSFFATLAIALGVCVLMLIGIWIVAGTVGAARDRAGNRRRRREHRQRPKIDMFKSQRGDEADTAP